MGNHNLSALECDDVVGWVVRDPDGKLWLRPTRGQGKGAMSIWLTKRTASEVADERTRYRGDKRPWTVVQVRLKLVEVVGEGGNGEEDCTVC